MGRGSKAAVAAVLVSAASAAGCGGGSSGGDGDALADLVGRLPEDATQVASMDVAVFRDDLGLPDDQGIDEGFDDSTRPLLLALGAAVPFLADPRSTPIREAFDTGAVTAVASVPLTLAPEQAVVVVRSSQSFDDLAAALEDEGYERDGDLVSTNDGVLRVGGITAVTSAGDDVIVLAQSTEVARAVAGGEGDGPALAAALDSVDGPLRMALGVASDGDSCVETIATGWQADPAEGEIVFTVSESQDADDVELFPGDGRPARDLDLDPAEADGRIVRARFRYGGPVAPFGMLSSDIGAGDLYRC